MRFLEKSAPKMPLRGKVKLFIICTFLELRYEFVTIKTAVAKVKLFI
jgi:hypothetical protein